VNVSVMGALVGAVTDPAGAFVKPHLEYGDLSPMLIVFGVACLGVLVEAFLPRERRYLAQTGLTVAGLVAALVATILVASDQNSLGGGAARGLIAASGTIVVDGPTVFFWGLILVFAIGGVLLFAERRLEGGLSAFAGQAAALPGSEAERQASSRGLDHTEVYPLLLFAVGGMMLFPASNDLLTMFVALEVLSLPLYLLCGLARRRRLLSQEAAMKYFLLGAFSSGFFLYGVALVYGFAGSMQLSAINEAVRNDTENSSLLLIGLGMLAVGLLFKVGAAPFQAWTPDVYQGAPTAVTAFMAACTKIAAFGAMLRLLYVAFGSDRWTWQPMLWVVAILTMVVGAVLAVVQTDVKRMLAYSSVAHTGFLLVGVLGVQSAADMTTGQVTSLQAVLFYLATYGFAMIGAFAVVTLVRDSGGEATQFVRWAGIGRRSPLVGAMFAFFLLSMAGIPLTAGFVGKWAVFTVALAAGAWPVVIAAVLCSIVAVFFYVRVIVLMFFVDGDGIGTTGEVAAVTTPSLLTSGTIAVGVLATLVLGIVPGPVLNLAAHAGQFVR
jgi:NADH-quinone oxidoreductase subunit N